MQKLASLPAPCYLCSITVISLGCAITIMGILLTALKILGYMGPILIVFGVGFITCGIAACVLMPKTAPRKKRHTQVPLQDMSREEPGTSGNQSDSRQQQDTRVQIEENGEIRKPKHKIVAPPQKIPCGGCLKKKGASGGAEAGCSSEEPNERGPLLSRAGSQPDLHLVCMTKGGAYYKKAKKSQLRPAGPNQAGCRLSYSESQPNLLGACSSIAEHSESEAEQEGTHTLNRRRGNTVPQSESNPNLVLEQAGESTIRSNKSEPTPDSRHSQSESDILTSDTGDELPGAGATTNNNQPGSRLSQSGSHPNLHVYLQHPQHPRQQQQTYFGVHRGHQGHQHGAGPQMNGHSNCQRTGAHPGVRSQSVRGHQQQCSGAGEYDPDPAVNGPGSNYRYNCVACMKQQEARRQQLGYQGGAGGAGVAPGVYPGPPYMPLVKAPLPGIIPQDDNDRSLPSYDEAVYGHAARH